MGSSALRDSVARGQGTLYPMVGHLFDRKVSAIVKDAKRSGDDARSGGINGGFQWATYEKFRFGR